MPRGVTSLDPATMHPWLAFVCFFRLLFGRKLPAEAAKYLPNEALALPEPKTQDKQDKKPEPQPVEKKEDKPKVSAGQQHREGALALLALLQREGRFVDFVEDSVDGASDSDIGAAAREIHRGCRKVIEQYLKLEPVMPGEQDANVAVPKGFDPAEVRLIGEAKGEPPYKGTLRHHGWRVVDAKLPALAEGVDRSVIAPAEVEV